MDMVATAMVAMVMVVMDTVATVVTTHPKKKMATSCSMVVDDRMHANFWGMAKGNDNNSKRIWCFIFQIFNKV